MWDRPILTIVVNLVVYVPLLLIFGFEVAPVITAVLSFCFFVYNLGKVGMFKALWLLILYLLLFDSTAYTFTSFNLRMWYLAHLIGLFLIVTMLVGRKAKLTRNNIFFLIPIGILFLMSAIFFVTEDFSAKLHNAKYWLFSVGLIFGLRYFFNTTVDHARPMLSYMMSLVGFVCIFGFIQYSFNIIGNFNLINTHGNTRPEAFFSETTWYGELIVLGIIMVPLMVKLTGNTMFWGWIPVFLVALALSNTRNAIVGLAAFTFFETIFFLLKRKRIPTRIRPAYFLAFVVGIIGIVVLTVMNLDKIAIQLADIRNRFNVFEEASSVGRLEAFKVSLVMVADTPFFGNGFHWDHDVAGEGNSAVGSKSFNILLMFYHIFGPFGFVVFLTIIGMYFYQLLRSIAIYPGVFARSAFYVFFIFFLMAQFAPMHQFPIGLLFVSFSIYLYHLGRNEKSLFRNA